MNLCRLDSSIRHTAWLFFWNVADSASAGIHGGPPIWLVGQVDLVYKGLLSHVLSSLVVCCGQLSREQLRVSVGW